MAKIKVNVTIEEALLERIDQYADENFMTRSGLVQLAVSQFLSAAEVSKALVDMSAALKAIAARGELSAEDKRQLDAFEQLALMLSAR